MAPRKTMKKKEFSQHRGYTTFQQHPLAPFSQEGFVNNSIRCSRKNIWWGKSVPKIRRSTFFNSSTFMAFVEENGALKKKNTATPAGDQRSLRTVHGVTGARGALSYIHTYIHTYMHTRIHTYLRCAGRKVFRVRLLVVYDGQHSLLL